MSNNNVGMMAAQTYPALYNSFILSKPPSLKTPEQCRERLQNFNLLADVTEALMAVSLLAGGIQSVIYSMSRLGLDRVHDSLRGSIPSAPQNEEMFRKSTLIPAVIRLEASLQLVKNSDPTSMDVGELDEARKLLISSLSKRNVESLTLYREFLWDN